MMLHNDEGYQKDVGDPKAMDAVLTELKQHPDRLPRYVFAQLRYFWKILCLYFTILVRAAFSTLHAMHVWSVCA